MNPDASLSKRELFLLTSLFLFESAIAIIVMALHMKGERTFYVFLSSRPGPVFLCAVAVFLFCGTDLVRRYLVHLRSRSDRVRLVVIMNLVSVLLIVIAGEIAVRAGSRSHMDGEAFGNVVLKPRSWDRTIKRQLMEKPGDDHLEDHLVHDDRMGWTIARNGCSSDGLYCSSLNGLRAPQGSVVFPVADGKREIAILGDSFTFGNEVSYGETWGHRLDRMLGDEFRVLNFGVGGYGLGQVFVRYEKEVRARRPTVVVLGFISHDLYRTMWVYPFIAMPEWHMPFSKPRFVLKNGALVNVNQTPSSTASIFGSRSISDLPLLEYDWGYRASDWEEHWYQFSYLARLLTSLFPSWEAAESDLSEDGLIAVNAALLKTFVRSTKDAGSIPLVLFFPMKMDLEREVSYVPLGKRVLEEAGVPYVDTTPCVSEVSSDERFLIDHYSPQGNEAVAKCVYKAVKDVLPRPMSG